MPSRRSIVAVLICFFTLTLSVAFAQDGKRLVIYLKDGKTVSGEFIEATPAVVKVKPNPKSDTILTVEWSKIRSLGNKMTREGIVKEWQKTHSEELCVTCHGTATTKCTTCDGTAVKPSEKVECTQCTGSGNLGPCKTPKCKDGKIPCPDKCLKADSFTGAPDAEGKRWRVFRGKDRAELRISDAHIGELVVVENGSPVNKGKCPTCDGTTIVDDPICGGTGLKKCNACKGKGVTGPKCDDCTAGLIECGTCHGTGLRPPETPTEQQPTTETPAAETPADVGATATPATP